MRGIKGKTGTAADIKSIIQKIVNAIGENSRMFFTNLFFKCKEK